MADVFWDMAVYEGTTDDLFLLLFDSTGALVNGAGGVQMTEVGGGGHFTATTAIGAGNLHAVIQVLTLNVVESTLYAGELGIGDIPTESTITVDAIVDGVWDEQQSLHTTAGSFGFYLDAQVSAISAASGSASGLSRANGKTNLYAYTDEDILYPPISVFDFDGSAFDPTGIVLEVVIETLDGTDNVVIADGDITPRTTSTIQFTVLGAVNVLGPVTHWSCRVVSTKQVIASGLYTVEYAVESGP